MDLLIDKLIFNIDSIIQCCFSYFMAYKTYVQWIDNFVSQKYTLQIRQKFLSYSFNSKAVIITKLYVVDPILESS
jgi:hypothetical protein